MYWGRIRQLPNVRSAVCRAWDWWRTVFRRPLYDQTLQARIVICVISPTCRDLITSGIIFDDGITPSHVAAPVHFSWHVRSSLVIRVTLLRVFVKLLRSYQSGPILPDVHSHEFRLGRVLSNTRVSHLRPREAALDRIVMFTEREKADRPVDTAHDYIRSVARFDAYR